MRRISYCVALAAWGCNGVDNSLVCEDLAFALCDIREPECQSSIYDEVRCLRAGAGQSRGPDVMGLALPAVAEYFDVPSQDETRDEPTPAEQRLERVAGALSLIGMVDWAEPDPEGEPEPSPPLMQDEKELFIDGLLGFYSSDTKSIVIVERPEYDFASELAVATLAHEYVHAIQDETHDLQETRREKGRGQDASLGITSLIEGEAMLFEAMHTAAINGVDHHRWASQFEEQTAYADSSLRTLPSPVWTSNFVFPYLYGGFALAQLWDEGGIAEIDEFWSGPAPATQLYMARRHGADAVSSHGRIAVPEVALDGFSVVADDVLGAWLLHAFLVRTLGQPETEPDLALDWRGDRVLLLSADDSTDVAIVWHLAFRSDAAAARFVELSRAESAPRGAWTLEQSGRRVVLVATLQSESARSALMAQQAAALEVEPSRALSWRVPRSDQSLRALARRADRLPLRGCVHQAATR